jgi:type II secretory pathway predicted ATPase ExeA
MHTAHGLLKHNPFDTHGPDRAWFPGGDHDEALSRMLYLVERGHGCGVVWGDHSIGKSRLLREIRRQSRQPSTTVLSLDVTGLSRSELAVTLANQCGAGFPAQTSSLMAWTALEDWLRGRAALHHHVVLLIDELDAAAESLESELLRLVRLLERTQTPGTMILAVQRPGWIEQLSTLADFVMELPAWDDDDSRSFIEQSLRNAGGSADMIADSAWPELLAAGHGHPRRLMRIMEVALLAGGVLESSQLSAELIAAVVHQLGWQSAETPHMLPVE